MKKIEGCHFYVNIKNFNQIILDEEHKTGDVNHALHALDTYFSSIESYGKKKYPNVFFVEKITGARLHMYVVDEISSSFNIVEDISKYSFVLSSYINKNIYKYRTLLDFEIQVGAHYGDFYDFIFVDDKYEEETTIGFVANFAAKLQALASNGCINVSKQLYLAMDMHTRNKFEQVNEGSLNKYGYTYYYSAKLKSLVDDYDYREELELAKKKSNEVNLSDINYRKATVQINFDHLSKKECKEVRGIPFFADVRGFTKKFEKDDSNLEEMTMITKDVLNTMYTVVKEKGIHVQFQGDREFAIYHNYGDYDCVNDAVIAGLKLIEKIKSKGYEISVGVGQSIGKMFVSKIGARGEKDNIVLGETVVLADTYEDKFADENQLVIGKEIYEILKVKNPILAKQFKKEKDYYKTEIGYRDYLNYVDEQMLKQSKHERNYNGAWRK